MTDILRAVIATTELNSICTDSLIFPSTVKPHWKNLHCTKRYINEGDLTITRTQTWKSYNKRSRVEDKW